MSTQQQQLRLFFILNFLVYPQKNVDKCFFCAYYVTAEFQVRIQYQIPEFK